MEIAQGEAQPAVITASDASLLATTCNGFPSGLNGSFPASSNNLNIDKDNFIDNRSGPIETVSSFLNALNLKQYVRAYSYYQNPTVFPGPFGPYADGYAKTDGIKVTFGTVQDEGAAGSLYYKVSLALEVLSISKTTQTFVGCYTLHLSEPALQAIPPFEPMGIIAGKFNLVTNGTNINDLLPTACK
jgi:hypothetical protein